MSEELRPRRRVYRVFVRPGAQFKLFAPFLVFMLAWTTILLLVAWTFHGMLDHLSAPAASLTANEIANLQRLNRNLLQIVLWGSLAAIVFSFGFWLSFSHHVFGPMVQIHRQIKRLKDGEVVEPIRLRRRDEFQNVAESLNELTDRLQGKDRAA